MSGPRSAALAVAVAALVWAPGAPSRAAGPVPAAAGEAVLATVGAREITVADFLSRWRLVPPEGGEERAAVLLERMIREELAHAEAVRTGLDRSPEVLEAVRRLLVARVRERELDPLLAGVAVSAEEVELRYREHPELFLRPRAVRGAVIRIGIPGRASPGKRAELEARAEAALAAARELGAQTRTLGSVAVRYSDDQATRYRGGDTGWLEPGSPGTRWEPEVVAALAALERPGEVGSLVRTGSARYVVRLTEERPAAVRPLEEVRGAIEREIRGEKLAAVEGGFYDRLRESTPVSVNEELLPAVIAAPGAPAAPPPLPAR